MLRNLLVNGGDYSKETITLILMATVGLQRAGMPFMQKRKELQSNDGWTLRCSSLFRHPFRQKKIQDWGLNIIRRKQKAVNNCSGNH